MKSLNLALCAAVVFTVLLLPVPAGAHCDNVEGPVVVDAKLALQKGDVTPVLKWVKQENEAEIKALFERTLAMRKKDAQVQELADTYFFETLVRIHRAGEGEPYTGLKPAGTKVDEGIEAADRALEARSVDALVQQITAEVGSGIRHRFEMAVQAEKKADSSVEAGREYVEAYATFLHYVERLHQAAASGHAH